MKGIYCVKRQQAAHVATSQPGASVIASDNAGTTPVEYPALQGFASATSRTGQRKYVSLVRADLFLLIGGAALSLAIAVSPHKIHRFEAIAAALLLVGSAVAKALNHARHFDRDWFQGRSVSESIKNVSWRYMMRVAPYDTGDDDADSALLSVFQELLHSFDTLRPTREWVATDPHFIPDAMRAVRSLPSDDRRAFYLRERVHGQLVWYAAKSEENDRKATLWYWISLVVQAAAALFALVQIARPDAPDLVAFLTIIAVACTAWNQLRQHEQLTKTYALVAHDLLLLRERIGIARDEETFGKLVKDTEETISREHTLWMAKRS